MEERMDISKLMENLGKDGFFVTSGATPNTMTASWGGSGVMWGKQLIAIPVRNTRLTHQLIRESGVFSISVPAPGKMGNALTYFGTHSGKDLDKYAASQTKIKPCSRIDTAIITGCEAYFECRVLYTSEVKPELLPDGYISKFYPHHDYHTIFYGEILCAYTK